MDNNILERKKEFERKDNINKVIGMMSFNNSKPSVIGSASLKSSRYPNDYDIDNLVFFKSNDEEYIKQQIRKKMIKIFETLKKNPDTFIIDFKLGEKDKKPLKWNFREVKRGFKLIDGERKYFVDALEDGSVVKLDVIALIDSEFMDMTTMYEFFKKNKDNAFKEDVVNQSQITKGISEDAIKQLKQGNYMKYLKRLFSIAKLKKNTKQLETLSHFLNTDLGKLYKCYNDSVLVSTLLENGDEKKLQKHKKNIIDFLQIIKASLGEIYQFSIMNSVFEKFNDIGYNDSLETIQKKISPIIRYLKMKVNKEAKKIIELHNIS